MYGIMQNPSVVMLRAIKGNVAGMLLGTEALCTH